MKNKLLVIFLFMSIFSVFSQKEQENNFLIELLETTIEANEENSDFNTLLEQYEDLHKHPLNINKATGELLVSSGLFTPSQALDIISYREVYGYFLEKEEIRTISSITAKEADFIIHFISTNSSESFSDLYRHGNHLLLSRYSRILEKQHAYENGDFEGNADKHYFRYRYSVTGSSSFGFTLEKDAGEAVDFSKNKQQLGYDYLSYHLFVKPRYGKYTIALGDYSLQFGQGLHLWNGYAMGKSAYALNVAKYGAEIRPYTSVNETQYLRGGALHYGNKLNTTLFVSHKSVDATTSDSATFSSFQTSGLHRTATELKNKNSIQETIAGTRLSYRGERLRIGATHSFNHFSLPLVKDNRAYNRFHFSGNQYHTGSIDYNYFSRNMEFFGETALQWNSDIASINGIKINHSPHSKFTLAHRHYGKSYFARYHNAFAEGTNPSNEQALYLGQEINFSGKWQGLVYADFYQFPWLRFGINAPSKGYDLSAQLHFVASAYTNMYIRLKYESKEEGVSSGKLTETRNTALIHPKETLRIRYHLSHSVNRRFWLRTRVEFTHTGQPSSLNGEKLHETGFLSFQDISWSTFRYRLELTARYALFDTDSFDSAIYAYESDVRYSFSVPAYYYIGSRYYLLLKYHLSKSTDLWLRFARFTYLDRDTIGSGDGALNSNKKSEIKFQLSVTL